MRSCTMHPRCQGFFFFQKGQGMWVFVFFILGKGDNYESFFFPTLGHGVFFFVMTHFMFLFCMQGSVNVQKELYSSHLHRWIRWREFIFLTYTSVSHIERIYFSHLHAHESYGKNFFFPTLRLEPNFCFDLVCKVVWRSKKSFIILFTCHMDRTTK
jgi:hypothetical protein